jgi:hypothetical protein
MMGPAYGPRFLVPSRVSFMNTPAFGMRVAQWAPPKRALRGLADASTSDSGPGSLGLLLLIGGVALLAAFGSRR